MNYIGKFISNFKEFYNEINAATLTGAIDVVVVRHEDGSYHSSPFHVRFGKMGVLRSKEKLVDIEINGCPVDIHMKLGETGEAFFVERIEDDNDISPFLGTSPILSSHFRSVNEDEVRSQDSGVEAEDTIYKLKSDIDDCDIVAYFSASVQASVDENKISCSIIEDSIQKVKRQIFNVKDQETQTIQNEVVDISNISKLHYEHTRSKSLTSGIHMTKEQKNLLEGHGSKTDVEETDKIMRSNRRRRKRRHNIKKKSIKSDNHSSDNSTTSEIADLSTLPVSAIGNEEIFVMDDISPCLSEQAGQSTSLPSLQPSDSTNWPRMTRSMGPDFHPFSDTDISPPPSAQNSRSSSPIKSDTEYEKEKQKSDFCTDESSDVEASKWSWTWGELPTPPSKVTQKYNDDASHTLSHGEVQNTTQVEGDQRSMIGSMFSFMRATKKARHNPEREGIYLDDLKLDELDPEVAALYFPRSSSLVNKVSAAEFRPVSKDDDNESGNGPSLPHSPHSVEGAIGDPKSMSDLEYEEALKHPFLYSRGMNDIAFSLCGSLNDYIDGNFPESLFQQSLVTYDDFCENPHLMHNPNLVIRMDNKYMNWSTAAPQILSWVLFQRPLTKRVTEDLFKEHMPKKEMKRTESRTYSWFSWGRSNYSDQKNTEDPTSPDDVGDYISIVAGDSVDNTPPEQDDEKKNLQLCDNSEVLPDDSKNTELDDSEEEPGFRYKKTLRLSDELVTKLNLRPGSNEAVFSVTTAYQGTTRCKCHIFLWNYDEKIVVSDIDGTITKSDVLGHILPIIGRDWAQGGVAQLFTKIKNNGYNFLYLSARAIGQSKITRDYLKSIKQDDLSLPEGPLLLNPTSLVNAFHREVIEKKPEEFKISCLKDIQALFPGDMQPFYAGYGNRVNDVWAYRAVGIPISRIFTINHKGELKHELTQTFQTTYSSLSDIAHHMFPPAPERDSPGEFSSLHFWRPLYQDYSEEIEMQLLNDAAK